MSTPTDLILSLVESLAGGDRSSGLGAPKSVSAAFLARASSALFEAGRQLQSGFVQASAVASLSHSLSTVLHDAYFGSSDLGAHDAMMKSLSTSINQLEGSARKFASDFVDTKFISTEPGSALTDLDIDEAVSPHAQKLKEAARVLQHLSAARPPAA